jgi:hypothetical protein
MICAQQHSCRICWQLNVRTPSFAKLLKTKSNFRGHQETPIRPFWGNPWVATIIVKARITTVSITYLCDAMNVHNTSPNHAKINPKLQWYVLNTIFEDFEDNSTSKHLHLQNYSKQNPIFAVTRKSRYDNLEGFLGLPLIFSRRDGVNLWSLMRSCASCLVLAVSHGIHLWWVSHFNLKNMKSSERDNKNRGSIRHSVLPLFCVISSDPMGCNHYCQVQKNTTVSITYLCDAMNIDNTSPNHAKMNPKLQWYVFNNILVEVVGNSTYEHLHLQNYWKQNPIFEVTRKSRYDHFEVICEFPRSLSRPESPPSRTHICVTPWTLTIPHQIMQKWILSCNDTCSTTFLSNLLATQRPNTFICKITQNKIQFSRSPGNPDTTILR